MSSVEQFKSLALLHLRRLEGPTCKLTEGKWMNVFKQGDSTFDGGFVAPQDSSYVLASPVVMNLTYPRSSSFRDYTPLREALPELPKEMYPGQVVLLKNPNRLTLPQQRDRGFEIGATNGITMIGEEIYLTRLNPGYVDGEITRPWIQGREPVFSVLKPLMQRNSAEIPHVRTFRSVKP